MSDKLYRIVSEEVLNAEIVTPLIDNPLSYEELVDLAYENAIFEEEEYD